MPDSCNFGLYSRPIETDDFIKSQLITAQQLMPTIRLEKLMSIHVLIVFCTIFVFLFSDFSSNVLRTWIKIWRKSIHNYLSCAAKRRKFYQNYSKNGVRFSFFCFFLILFFLATLKLIHLHHLFEKESKPISNLNSEYFLIVSAFRHNMFNIWRRSGAVW